MQKDIVRFFRSFLALTSGSRFITRPLVFLMSGSAVLAFLVIAGPSLARVQSVTFKIPPTKIPLEIKDHQVAIIASGLIVLRQQNQGLNILTLELTADLSDLQQNMTDLLSSELDKDDHCGDNIAIQHATLAPAGTAVAAVAQLHYERWGCAKVFGKQQSKRLVGGNAVVRMKLTPAVEENQTELRLLPEVDPIEADGSLGELLRSGTLGEMLQDKIRKAILSAMRKGTDLSATLPPAIQGYASIEKAQFQDAGSGRLLVVLGGKIQITNDQLQALSKQVRDRVASQ